MHDGLNRMFSFIVLTYNEELHLPRLIQSFRDLDSPLFVLDSGSTDNTVNIAQDSGATLAFNKFDSHPLQWEYALQCFKIRSPWTIALDADQYLSEELYVLLNDFHSESIPEDVNGIYFNRKNYFKGKWIKHGGYFPKYMLKMFRTGAALSSHEEKLDHRFVVKGDTWIWKKGYLIEENLKENKIAFWIQKHNKYSDIIAQDEFNTIRNMPTTHPVSDKESPDDKARRRKLIWRQMPLIIRPSLYFFFRYIIQLGFLDGRIGFIFHFLHAFWFRFIIDIKILELKNAEKSAR